MDKVYKFIIQKTVTDKIDKKDAVHLLELLKQEKDKKRQLDIAVIGMAAKTSRADNVRDFWANLEEGVDGIRKIPLGRQRDLDEYLRFKKVEDEMAKYRELAYLDEIDKFDYEYFNLLPKEAELMDPNQRLFLQAAYTAIEDAGYNHADLKGTKTGLYLGFITANFTYQNLLYEVDAAVGASTILANMAALIPSRVSYLLDLRGPSILVDTTCSSSLVAVHLACQAIRSGECEQALVGGVKINLMPLLNGPKIGIESSSARTLAFDEASDGTGQGEGVGVVMLKPLKQALRDGDNIQAVIKGSAINQDGRSIGITAPNTEAQTEVISAAWDAARVDPETISYIEAHGTGTKLGDPI
ncbi:MAG: polyketide synthase, partial [Candidatus Magasanikbacteria bacterium]|nr:polyketide synthase [Candidatus Magasanikbacteria bacterium]